MSRSDGGSTWEAGQSDLIGGRHRGLNAEALAQIIVSYNLVTAFSCWPLACFALADYRTRCPLVGGVFG